VGQTFLSARIPPFEPSGSFDCHRLQIVVGAYQVHGIAAYSAEDGQERWRRRDLKKVQHVTFNGDDSRALCCFDRGPCESLNAATGKSGRSLRGVRGVWESPFGPHRLLERARDYALADFEAPTALIPRITFGILSAAFSPTLVCLSEAGGPVRAFDLSSGAEAWRHTPPKGSHFLRIGFDEASQSFAGVSWPFERGGPVALQRFSPSNGSPQAIAQVGSSVDTEFCLGGSRLVTASGTLYDVASGRQVGSLPFLPGSPFSTDR
jgi:hypothetical protein